MAREDQGKRKKKMMPPSGGRVVAILFLLLVPVLVHSSPITSFSPPPVRGIVVRGHQRCRRASSTTVVLKGASSTDLRRRKKKTKGNKSITTAAKGNKKKKQSSKRKRRTEQDLARENLVKTLSQAASMAAAKEAAVKAAEKERREAQNMAIPFRDLLSSTEPPPKKMASLSELMAAIDQQLLSKQVPFTEQNRFYETARDSMTAVVLHNDKIETTTVAVDPPASAAAAVAAVQYSTTLKHVAVVLSKPLMEDQVTDQYASRIRRLVRAVKHEHYSPHVICFVGGLVGDSLLADCDAGYTYFRHLAASQGLDLSEMDFHLERSGIQDGALLKVTDWLQKTQLLRWMKETAGSEGATLKSSRRRVKLHVQFALVSSEYHLCVLNDIHSRSPSRSPLAALENDFWKVPREKRYGEIVLETSWTYQYATTAVLQIDRDPITAFASKCYRTAQELIPVLHNLRGVVDNSEFFQRDNYRVLVSARRRLASDMEDLYSSQPDMRAVKRVVSTTTQKPLDVVLEGTLLSLGRCVDLVRPAGLLTGSVPSSDFRVALTVLEKAVHQITVACDTDKPLEPAAWGRLNLEDNQEEGEESTQDVDD